VWAPSLIGKPIARSLGADARTGPSHRIGETLKDFADFLGFLINLVEVIAN
jgi:hypothetical protein